MQDYGISHDLALNLIKVESRDAFGRGYRLYLIVGDLVFVVADRENQLFSHVSCRACLLDDLLKDNKVALRQHPHRIEGGAGTGLLSAFKDPEIMRSRLNDKTAFADVAIDQKLSQKFGFFGADSQKFVVGVALYRYLFSSRQVERFFGGESQSVFALRLHRSAVTSLFIENEPVIPEVNPFSVVFSDHFLSSPAACRDLRHVPITLVLIRN